MQTIHVTPNADNKLIVRLYGEDLEIIVDKKAPAEKPAKKADK